MKFIGYFLIAFGLLDLVGSYIDIDVWGGWLGVQLPDFLWSISSYIELGLGYLLMSLGSKSEVSADE